MGWKRRRVMFERMWVVIVASVFAFAVSFAFGVPYVAGAESLMTLSFAWVALIVLLWFFSLFNPLAPTAYLYKGLMTPIFALVGLLHADLFGFAVGWVLMCFMQGIADTARYRLLSRMTGGATPEEIIPFQVAAIIAAGLGVFGLLYGLGCPPWSGSEDFLIKIFAKEGLSEEKTFLLSIAWNGAMFAGFRQLVLISVASEFANKQGY